MLFSGFTKSDFEVFSIDGLENRMDALQTHIRPKLEALGDHFAPSLSVQTGVEVFAHVAKHARRKVNPPNDTWVAFASNSRGYKMLPHFQIGLWGSHVFIWFAMIYEAPNKAEYAKVFQSKVNEIQRAIPNDFVWSIDHMKPDVIKHEALSKEELTDMFVRLQTIKKAELLCGYQILKEDAIKMTGQQMVEQIEHVFSTLLPLYKLVQ